MAQAIINPVELNGAIVDYCHQHNLVEPDKTDTERKFGISNSLPRGDTFRNLLGDDWSQTHWFATEAERDLAYDAMSERHGYYRETDSPTQVLIKIVR